jgi:hypothetical protein
MIPRVLASFPLPWLTCLGLAIFFVFFLAMLVWVFRRGSGSFYSTLALQPLEGETTRGASHE